MCELFILCPLPYHMKECMLSDVMSDHGVFSDSMLLAYEEKKGKGEVSDEFNECLKKAQTYLEDALKSEACIASNGMIHIARNSIEQYMSSTWRPNLIKGTSKYPTSF